MGASLGLSFRSLGRDVLEHSFEVHPVQVQISTLPRRAATRWDLHEALFLVGILGNQVGFGAGSIRIRVQQNVFVHRSSFCAVANEYVLLPFVS